MQKRPRIRFELSKTQKFFDLLGWLFILFCWLFTIINYSNLPDTIPIHRDGSGNIDGWGSKAHIWLLLLITTAMYGGITLLSRYPHILGYGRKITEENALEYYTSAIRMLRFLKLVTVLLFGTMIFKTIFY